MLGCLTAGRATRPKGTVTLQGIEFRRTLKTLKCFYFYIHEHTAGALTVSLLVSTVLTRSRQLPHSIRGLKR